MGRWTSSVQELHPSGPFELHSLAVRAPGFAPSSLAICVDSTNVVNGLAPMIVGPMSCWRHWVSDFVYSIKPSLPPRKMFLPDSSTCAMRVHVSSLGGAVVCFRSIFLFYNTARINNTIDMDGSIVFATWRQCALPWNTCFLAPPSESIPQTASRSVQPFLRSSRQSMPILYIGPPFRKLQKRMNQSRCRLGCGLRWVQESMGCTWRHLANMTKPFMCGGNAAFLSSQFDHLSLLRMQWL